MKNLLKHFGGDRVIWALILILTIYSGLAVASSVASLAYRSGTDVTVFIIRHSSYLVGGWFIIYVTHLIPYRWYGIFAPLLMVVSVVLLTYTLIRGEAFNEAARWLKVPGTRLTFQTSDFAKMILIVFVARYLSRHQAEISEFKTGFLPVVLWIVLVCGLIMKANLSTAAILFATCMLLLYIGRVKVLYLLGLAGVGVLVLSGYLLISSLSGAETRAGTWQSRIETFTSGEGEQFQSKVARIAIANGGMTGRFAGHSTQRHSLPEAHSDFIFAIIIEEYGFFFGALPLVFIFMILLYRAGVIVKRCDRTFPAFLAIGLALGMVLQAMANMGVAVGLLPVTGQPLPWISKGGTSIVFTGLAFGIILGISRSLDEEEAGLAKT